MEEFGKMVINFLSNFFFASRVPAWVSKSSRRNLLFNDRTYRVRHSENKPGLKLHFRSQCFKTQMVLSRVGHAWYHSLLPNLHANLDLWVTNLQADEIIAVRTKTIVCRKCIEMIFKCELTPTTRRQEPNQCMEQSKDPARRGHGGHKKRRQSQVDYISVSPSGQTDWALEMSDMNGSRVPTSDTWKDITGRRETKTSRRSNRIGSHERREGKKIPSC